MSLQICGRRQKLPFRFCCLAAILFAQSAAAQTTAPQSDNLWTRFLAQQTVPWTQPEGNEDGETATFRSPAAEAGAGNQQILITVADRKTHSWRILQSLLDDLITRDLPVDIHVQSLQPANTDQPDRAAADQLLIDASKGMAVLVGVGARASDLLHRQQAALDMPLVATGYRQSDEGGPHFGGATGRESDALLGFTGTGRLSIVPDGLPLTLLIGQWRKIWPKLRQTLIIYERGDTATINQLIRPAFVAARADGRLQLRLLPIDTRKNMALQVAQGLNMVRTSFVPPNESRDQTVIWITGGRNLSRYIPQIQAAAGPIPTISQDLSLVDVGGAGVAVAIGLHANTTGRLAGAHVSRLLKGVRVPFYLTFGAYTKPDIAINFQQTQRIGLKIPFSFFESAVEIIGPDGAKFSSIAPEQPSTPGN